MRREERAYLGIPVPVYIDDDTSYGSFLRDISDNGVQVAVVRRGPGSIHEVGAVRRFRVRSDFLAYMEPVEFTAECRWTKPESPTRRVAGYRIAEITEDNRDRLRRLIEEFNVDAAIEI